MLKRDWIKFGLLQIANLALTGIGRAASGADRIVLPPDQRVLTSPSGRFVLVLFTNDHWKTRRATARLFEQTAEGRRERWHQTLPQELGPRRGWITEDGTAVLVDDWINVPSLHALMVIGPDGQLRAHKSIDQLIALVGVSKRTVADNGKLGIWLGGEPRLSTDQRTMTLAAGGRELCLSLADGQLTLSPTGTPTR